jgi:hypothetical protein
MKIKLTPEFSYLAGITRYAGVRKGVGVRGSQSLQQAFAKGAMDAGIASPQKMIVKGSSIRFFHSAYEAYFSRVQNEAVDKFKHLNDYSSAYLAGVFDSVGGVFEGGAYMQKCDRQDEAIFDNLGFGGKIVQGRFYIGHHEHFLKFISKYRKVPDAELGSRR